MSFKPAAILGFSMSARINIGVRHVLPVYALMAAIAAVAPPDTPRSRRSFQTW
ncbi:MAG: hypothetical protein HYR60_03520 [Acidobacteria bacterium]|nr:hypothetical protein [Acidobacteriota bacterium]